MVFTITRALFTIILIGFTASEEKPTGYLDAKRNQTSSENESSTSFRLFKKIQYFRLVSDVAPVRDTRQGAVAS